MHQREYILHRNILSHKESSFICMIWKKNKEKNASEWNSDWWINTPNYHKNGKKTVKKRRTGNKHNTYCSNRCKRFFLLFYIWSMFKKSRLYFFSRRTHNMYLDQVFPLYSPGFNGIRWLKLVKSNFNYQVCCFHVLSVQEVFTHFIQ